MPPRNYRSHLVALLSFIDGEDYEQDQEFTPERLDQITADEVRRFFNYRIYENEEPGDDMNELQPQVRSNSVMYWKKAISYYLPNKLHPWNQIHLTGNPTRSVEVNNVIQKVKTLEVRGRGRPSQARRDMEEEEFRHTIDMFRADDTVGDINARYGIPALMITQFSLIGRVDDGCMWMKENFRAHRQAEEIALQARWPWSKNCREERHSPWQMLLGAQDPYFCVMLNLALWLEIHLRTVPGAAQNPYLFGFSDDYRIPQGGKNNKSRAQTKLREVIRGDPFYHSENGPLGTHSTRKYARTAARRNGVTKDHADLRGRWHSESRVSDVYDSTEMPYIDSMVCSILCFGGPINYKLKEGSGIDKDFIINHVTPSINDRFGDKIAFVLGKALLWACFSDVSGWVPENLREQIIQAYNAQRQLEEGVNPVEKVSLVVSNNNGQTLLTEVNMNEQNEGQPGQPPIGSNDVRQMLHAILAQNTNGQRQTNEAVRSLEQRLQDQSQRLIVGMRTLSNRVGRLHRAPAQAEQAAPEIPIPPHEDQVTVNASLSPTPRTLNRLWEEWMHGIDGRKAARLFTPTERGKEKHKFHRRKVIWDLINGLIRQGNTANQSIERIYNVYGQGSTVTSIINSIKRDRRNGNLHPDLTV